LYVAPAGACVNLDINVGTIDTPEGRLYAAIVSTFVHERTGTKSIIKYFSNTDELYAAVTDKKVEMIVTDAQGAFQFGKQPAVTEKDAVFQAAQEIYKKEFGLILLKPFGREDGQQTSPMLAEIVLEKFPALPRLLKKLAGKIDAATSMKLIASVKEGGEKPGRVAKNFLVSKRLI